MNDLLLTIASSISVVICLVWALLLIGAWAFALINPSVFKIIAIKQVYADKILRTLVRELAMLIVAVALGVAALINRNTVLSEIELVASQALSNVGGDFTPPYIVASLDRLAPIHMDLQRTILAYNSYFQSANSGNVTSIMTSLGNPKRWNEYDYRLAGLINDVLARKSTGPERRTYIDNALTYYEKAIELSTRHDQVDSQSKFRSTFQVKIRTNIASLNLDLADIETDPAKKEQFSEKAINGLIKLKQEEGTVAAIYVNLAEAFVVKGERKNDRTQLSEAIRTLCELAGASLVPAEEILYTKGWVLEKKNVPELKPLIDYVAQTRHETWEVFINKVWGHDSAICSR